jgi:hypothetical protein
MLTHLLLPTELHPFNLRAVLLTKGFQSGKFVNELSSPIFIAINLLLVFQGSFKVLQHSHEAFDAHIDIRSHLLTKAEFHVSSVPFEGSWEDKVIDNIPS